MNDYTHLYEILPHLWSEQKNILAATPVVSQDTEMQKIHDMHGNNTFYTEKYGNVYM